MSDKCCWTKPLARQLGGRGAWPQMTAEVALGHVGIVLGLEVSRLARNNADWYRLLDLCGAKGHAHRRRRWYLPPGPVQRRRPDDAAQIVIAPRRQQRGAYSLRVSTIGRALVVVAGPAGAARIPTDHEVSVGLRHGCCELHNAGGARRENARIALAIQIGRKVDHSGRGDVKVHLIVCTTGLAEPPHGS